MANRHLARSIVLQTLFEWDVAEREESELEDILTRNAEEFAPGMDDLRYPKNLLSGVMEKRQKLDEVIEQAAPDWPIPKLDIVDRNVLRIGLYELLFADRDEVPPKVALNEAIELAKGFGSDTSGGFVNGVLGAIYREIGEPGKNQTSKKKKNKIKDIPYEEMPIEQLGGAVVYAETDDGIMLALVHDVFGHWTLSKGHIETGDEETIKSGIKEKVKEETGLDKIELKDKLGDNEYVASDPEKGKIRKQVVYYLGEADYQELELPEDKGGLDAARWFELDEDILELNFYDDILPIVTKAVKILHEGEE